MVQFVDQSMVLEYAQRDFKLIYGSQEVGDHEKFCLLATDWES